MRRAILLTVALFGLALAACGSDQEPDADTGVPETVQTPEIPAENSPEAVVRRFLLGIELNDANLYLDALDPQLRSQPGYGAARVLLQSLAYLFGVTESVTHVAFRELEVVAVSQTDDTARVSVKGRLRNLDLFQEERFEEFIEARRIDGTWYVSELSPDASRTAQAVETPNALTQAVVGPNGCLALSLPRDWEVEDYKGIIDGDTAYCPGGSELDRTRTLDVCDERAELNTTGLLNADGPAARNTGGSIDHESVFSGGSTPGIFISHLAQRCSSIDDQLRILPSLLDGVSVDRMTDLTINSRPVKCAELSAEEYRALLCLVEDSAGDIFLINAGSIPSQWDEIRGTLIAILESIELRRV